ncbi:MAG: HAD-IC family P-type ATPase [Cellulomonadaceae bacterium]
MSGALLGRHRVRTRAHLPRNHHEVAARTTAPTAATSSAGTALAASSAAPPEQVLTSFGTSAAGLSEDRAAALREQHGPNTITQDRPPTLAAMVLDNLRNPFVLLLLVLGGVLYGTGDVPGGTTIAVMVVISVALRLSQQVKAERAARALTRYVVTSATVLRPGTGTAPVPQQVTTDRLVPGDVVQLAAGDLVPADLRVITAKDLAVSQASLTGESAPQNKVAAAQQTTAEGVLRATNLCFMGTSVVSGTGTAVVVATGAHTYFGTMAHVVATATGQSTYDRSIRQVSLLLVRLMLVLAPAVLLFNGLHTGDWLSAAFFAVAVAVGLTPAMLPTIVSANLARGAQFMSRKKVIVKVPDAIQNLGSMDVLCTDKTGTLTEDRIVLERFVDIADADSDLTLLAGYLNSAHHTGVRDVLDDAVVAAFGAEREAQLGSYRVVDEVPFDFDRRRLSVILDRAPDARNVRPASSHPLGGWPPGKPLAPDEDLLITKGAVAEVLGVCSHVVDGGQAVAITDAQRAAALATVARENERGMKVLAVAVRVVPGDVARARLHDGVYAYGPGDETDMTLVGFLTFLDPPKESAADAVRSLRGYGVATKVISGDARLVTRHVVDSLDIWGDLPADQRDGATMTGAEVDALDDDDLRDRVEHTVVFAEMSPLQKGRVVRAVQAAGHVTGYMGDGINDAPALRQADVGISVTDGVDIAKQTADIILLEQDLRVLLDGVVEGRRTFGNIQKYLKVTVSSNFGNVLSILIASVAIPFLPMLAIQLLVQNMLYDFCQAALPWDRVDKEFLAKPRRWSAGNLPRFMVWLGPTSSVFDVATFSVLWFVIGATGRAADGSVDVASQHLFQTGWFVVGLLTQTLVIHMTRTRKIPFVQSTATRPVLIASVVTCAIGVGLPFSPVASALDLVPLPGTYFAWLVAIVLAYCVVTQLVKMVYIRRYHEWL